MPNDLKFVNSGEADHLASELLTLAPADAAETLARYDDALVAEVLQQINP